MVFRDLFSAARRARSIPAWIVMVWISGQLLGARPLAPATSGGQGVVVLSSDGSRRPLLGAARPETIVPGQYEVRACRQIGAGWRAVRRGLQIQGRRVEGAEVRALVASGGRTAWASQAPVHLALDRRAELPDRDLLRAARQAIASPGRSPAPGHSVLRRVLRFDGERIRRLARVTFMDRARSHPIEVELDAVTGSPRAVRPAGLSGGFLLHGTEPIFFATRGGVGSVFQNASGALQSRVTRRRFRKLSRQDVTSATDGLLFPAGSLVGKYATVITDRGVPARSARLRFRFSIEQQPDRFDQSNAYYQLSSFARAVQRRFGRLTRRQSLPVLVNVAGLAGGRFLPDDAGLGLGSPSILLGELPATDLWPEADACRDPGVIGHEYAHLLLAEAGLDGAGEPIDSPVRAMIEGSADYLAASSLKRPVLGEVLAARRPDLFASRNLDGAQSFSVNLQDVINPESGLPDEHAVGALWGALLWDLRTFLGPRKADRMVRSALPLLPGTLIELGLPPPTPASYPAIARSYFQACVLTLLRVAGALKNVDRVFGAGISRGFLSPGPPYTVAMAIYDHETRAVTAEMHAFGHVHDFPFISYEPTVIGLTILVSRKSDLNPIVEITSVDGDPDAVSVDRPPRVSHGGRRIVYPRISLRNGTDQAYRVRIRAHSGAGRYLIKLKSR